MLKTSFLLLLSFNVWADTTKKTMVCPAITSEASSIINSIQGLKNQLKSFKECEPIETKLSEVSKIMTGKEWVKIKATLEEGNSFEVNQLKNISELTENASFALNDVIGQVTNNQNCVDEKNQASFMAKLSGVVREVSTVIGSVAGPYGMAVTLGGTLVSSAISGIDKYYKSQHPYKFSNADDELLFMNQFCAYAEIQKDMNDYLNLELRPVELDSLENYMNIKQNDLEANCLECKAQVIAFKAREKSDLILNRITEDAQIVELGKDQTSSNFTRCTEINRAIYSDNSDLNQFFKLLASYQNPMMSTSDSSLINAYVLAAKDLPNNYPNLQDCWALPLDEKIKISQTFNDFIRDEVLPLGNTTFGQQITGFKIRANKKYVNPLGDYTEKTLLRRKWIAAERDRVKMKLNDPNYESSVQMIITHKQKLERRIFDELMVDYIKFLRKRNLKQIRKFENDYQRFVNKSLKEYSALLGKPVNSVDEILKELEKRPTIDRRPFLSLVKDKKNDLDLTINSTKTLDRYCHFMNYMLITTRETNAICNEVKTELKADYEKISKLDNLTKDYIAKKLTWLVMDGNFQSSRVMDFSIHLRDWLAEGNARWELKPIPDER